MHYSYSKMSVLLQGHCSHIAVAAATPFSLRQKYFVVEGEYCKWPESLITANANNCAKMSYG